MGYDLTARIRGDSNEWTAAVRKAIDETVNGVKEIEDAGDEMADGMKKGFEGINLTMVGLTAGFALLSAEILKFNQMGMREWQVAEDAAASLSAIIQASGRDVQGLTADYKAFATELQNITVIGDDTTIAMLAKAEALGLSGERAKLAVREAIALAAAMDMDARGAIRLTALLAEGNTMMLTRYFPTLRSITDETERAAKAHELLGNMFAVAEAKARTTSGAFAQLNNDWGDLSEDVGRFLSEIAVPFVRQLNEIVKWMKDWDEDAKRVAFSLAQLAAVLSAGGALMTGLRLFKLEAAAALVPIKALATIGVITIAINFLLDEETLKRLDDIRNPINMPGLGQNPEFADPRSRDRNLFQRMFGGPEPVGSVSLPDLIPGQRQGGVIAGLLDPFKAQIQGFVQQNQQQEQQRRQDRLAGLGTNPFSVDRERRSLLAALGGAAPLSGQSDIPVRIVDEKGKEGLRDISGFLERREPESDSRSSFRSNLQEEERQFLAMQAGRRGGPEEQTAEGVQQLIGIQNDMLQIVREQRRDSPQLAAANF